MHAPEDAVSFHVPSLPLTEAGPLFAVLLLVVLAAPLLARRLRAPDVVVLVLLGVMVGPQGLGLLERTGAVEAFGSAGLLLLMFLAGLELDLDDFRATRTESVVFGVATFVLPIVSGTAVALLLGLDLLPAVLIGSCWSSHTLLTYPQFRRAGTAGHRAVTATVGATIVTDTAALLVLVVVVRAAEGVLGPALWMTLVPSFGLLVAAVLWGLPRAAQAFFAGPGQDGLLRLVFVLAALFVVAALTELTGVEPIVGAFLAGLALNRSVPAGSVLMERVELIGSALFVPVFLVATGMLVDPRVLVRSDVLLMGVAFTAVALGAKAAAAWVAGRLLGHDRRGVLAMVSLSSPQAAATLAAVVVGREAGLVGEGVVDAVVLVILVTCLASSLLAERVAPTLESPPRTRPFGATVVVPVVNPSSSGPLLRLAAAFARADAGLVVPLVVAAAGSDDTVVADRRSLLQELAVVARSIGVEALPRLRIDTSSANGIVHTVDEVDGSLLVLGMQQRSSGPRIGAVVEDVLATTCVPSLVVRDADEVVTRVVVVAPVGCALGEGRDALVLSLRAAAARAGTGRASVTVLADGTAGECAALVTRHLGVVPTVVTDRRPSEVLAELTAGDLLVLPSPFGGAGGSELAARILRQAPPGATVVVALARGGGPRHVDRVVTDRPRPVPA